MDAPFNAPLPPEPHVPEGARLPGGFHPPMWLIIGGVGLVAFGAIKVLGNFGGQAAAATAPAPDLSQGAVAPGSSGSSLGGQTDPTALLAAVAGVQGQTFAATSAAMAAAYQAANQEANDKIASNAAVNLAQFGAFGGELAQERQSYTSLMSQASASFASDTQTVSGMGSSEASVLESLAALFSKPTAAAAPSLPTVAQEQQNAAGLGIPVYDVQGYVGAHGTLPDSIANLDAYLNSAGLRDPNTGHLLLPGHF